jgi:hypothetical protein
MFGGFDWSTERVVATTWMSLRMCPGKSDLIERSIILDVSVAVSEGLPSLFMKPPGILPAE